MNNKFKDIFKNLKQTPKHDHNDRVLIIDVMNTFIRSFTMSKHINPKGHHVGGLTGFLKSLGYVSKIFRPTRIFLAFEGEGSHQNKRYIFPEYKTNRNVKSLTKWEYFEDKDEEDEAMYDQLMRLVEYTNHLPVTPISINNLEADDVISYLCDYYNNNPTTQEVTILSADHDFYQLINGKIQIYNPIDKKIITSNHIINKYNVHPNNYIIYKILKGDNSDNIPGVKGLGPKKIEKYFPELINEDEVKLEDIYNKCLLNEDNDKLLNKIYNYKHQLEINNKLMNLKILNFSDKAKQQMDDAINSPRPKFNVGGFISLYNQDLLGNTFTNPGSWASECFSFL